MKKSKEEWKSLASRIDFQIISDVIQEYKAGLISVETACKNIMDYLKKINGRLNNKSK